MAKRPPKQSRTKHWLKRLNYTGLAVGVICYCLSLLPSLMPRPWLYQGLISGISFATGYGLGVLASLSARWFMQWEPKAEFKKYTWWALHILGPIAILVFLYLGGVWQNDVRKLVNEEPIHGGHMVSIFVLSVLVALLLLTIGRGLARFNRFMIRQVDKLLPRRLSILVGVFLSVMFIYWVISGILISGLISMANSIYSKTNSTTPAGITQPTSPYRSGSPESLIKWDTLGAQGQAFVSRGPSQKQLADYTGAAPTEQIRVYAGLKSATTARQRAKLAVDELVRTGAFDRKVLILATTTGTGWLQPQSTDSIEYMYGGNSAIVTQQYSYLPSWISFLVDEDNATAAGQELYNAVYAKWSTLPKESRPKLIAYGLSLGSFGGQAAYTGASDLLLSTDGALFEGTPSSTTLWNNISKDRDPGSPQWQPIYEGGKSIRFAATNQDITQNTDGWTFPRGLYMQHASDPVVWFSFDLLLHKPDWLNEKRGPDVSPTMRWYPFVTFFQVTVDQFFGVTVPNGHGHNYPNTIVNEWGAVVPPADWNAQKATKLQDIINTYANE